MVIHKVIHMLWITLARSTSPLDPGTDAGVSTVLRRGEVDPVHAYVKHRFAGIFFGMYMSKEYV